MEDRRCKLGLAGRLELVRAIEQYGRGSPLHVSCAADDDRRFRFLFH